MSREGTHRQSRTRDAVSLVFSFFLSLALVAEAALLVAYIGFSASGFLSVLDDEYYVYALSYLSDQARYYTMPTGIDTDVLDGVFNEGELRFHTRQHVQSAFAGEDYVPDTTDLEARLADHVNAFLAEHGVTVSDQTEEVVAAYTEDIVDIYRDVAKLPGLETITRVRAQALRYTFVGLAACSVGIVVLLVLILRLHHFPHRGLRYVAYATGGAALMCFVVPCALYQSKFYLGLNLTPRYFYHFGVSLVARTLLLCMCMGGALLGITLLLVLWISQLRRSKLSHGAGRHLD